MDQQKIDEYRNSLQESAKEQALLDTIKNSGETSKDAIIDELSKTHTVVVKNDLAKPSDIERVVDAVDSLGDKLQPTDVQPVVEALKSVTDAIGTLPTSFPDFPAFPELPTPPKEVGVTNLAELESYFNKVVEAVGKLQTSIKFDPKIEVKPADVVVNEKEVNLKPLTDAIKSLETVVKGQKLPETDIQPVVNAVKTLNTSINSLSFPVPNYVLPFKDASGAATQPQLDSDGRIPVALPPGGGGLTDTELRASPVPISGTVTTTAPDIQNVELVNVLRSLLQAVSIPSWYDPTTNTLRVGTTAVTISSGTVTTVTTVGTVTNLTNFGTNAADVMARDTSINTWANVARRTIS